MSAEEARAAALDALRARLGVTSRQDVARVEVAPLPAPVLAPPAKPKNAWAVYSASKKYFNEGFDHKGFSVITVTDKGMELISSLYLKGKLQMLKGETPVSAEELEAKLNA